MNFSELSNEELIEAIQHGSDEAKDVFVERNQPLVYAMARRFGIVEKLPILIAEKMGPHFAVGDTCYSWSEDSAVYNPDGKEIIARDNEVSLMRKEDPSRAYYGCHTDITIPYSELGDITAVCRDGETLKVIQNGRFAVEGTELLNNELGE
mgnify:CR=1 FL=1